MPELLLLQPPTVSLFLLPTRLHHHPMHRLHGRKNCKMHDLDNGDGTCGRKVGDRSGNLNFAVQLKRRADRNVRVQSTFVGLFAAVSRVMQSRMCIGLEQ